MGDLMEKIEIQKLMKILNERDIMFTVEDIRELMESELDKPPEEMDTELIDLCAAAIGRPYNARRSSNPPLSPEAEAEIDAMLAEYDTSPSAEPEPENEPENEPEQNTEPETQAAEQPHTTETVPVKRKLKAGKILLVAAIVALFGLIAVPAGARFFPSETSDKIIDFCYDHFKIDLRENKADEASENNNDLVNNLILESLHTLKLPEVLLSDEYEKSARVQEDDLITMIHIDIKNINSDISGTIIISQYKNETVELHNGVGNISSMYKYFEQLSADDTDILVFGNDGETYIKYIDKNTEYEIFSNCDFDTALKIAESIK